MTEPRRVARRTAVLAAVLLLGAGLGAPTARGFEEVAAKAVASSITETVAIPAENYTVYSFSLWIGETVTYAIQVT